jgi:hypothetical protein
VTVVDKSIVQNCHAEFFNQFQIQKLAFLLTTCSGFENDLITVSL